MESFIEGLVSGIAIAVGGAFIILVAACFTAIPVWILWNWLMPELFSLSQISIFQAWGIAALSGALFKTTVSGK